MTNQLTKITLVAVINGVEHALDTTLDPRISERACNTAGLKKLTEGLAGKLGELTELEGVFPRSDASKYKLTEDGKVIERPDSDFKQS